MQLRYIDTRPKAPNRVFELDQVFPGMVRLLEIESRRTHLVRSEEFTKHYDQIGWPE